MEINRNLSGHYRDAMNFLNEIQLSYPEAISFAAGRPDDKFFNVQLQLNELNTYVGYYAALNRLPETEVLQGLGQYNKTKGIISEILADYLHNDENITAEKEEIIVTIGAQEAFAITVKTICNADTDVILVENPCYIGVTDFAKISGLEVCGVHMTPDGIDLADLEAKLQLIALSEKKAKLLYLMPNFQNPTGSSMPEKNKSDLLAIAEKYDFLILEDTAYNSFAYHNKPVISLKSMDAGNRVIYVGSFSKSLFPGLRLGVLVATQYVKNDKGEFLRLADEMAKVKAILTVNTPTINQAILGGILLKNGCSLMSLNEIKKREYKIKRDAMLDALHLHLGNLDETDPLKGISWSRPEGGFFLAVKLPFTITKDHIISCAGNFGVLVCPMSYFFLHEGGEKEIRLTFASLSAEQISKGVQQLSAFLKLAASVSCKKNDVSETGI